MTGAAGMVGRKLTGQLGSRRDARRDPIEQRPRRCRETGRSGRRHVRDRRRSRRTSPTRDVAELLVGGRPDVIFHLAAVVSGEAEADFEKGYRVNLDGTRFLLDAVRAIDGLPPARRLRIVDRRLRNAVSGRDRRRLLHHTADELRDAEGDRRASPQRLHTARLPRRESASGCRRSASARARPTRRHRGSSRESSASR